MEDFLECIIIIISFCRNSCFFSLEGNFKNFIFRSKFKPSNLMQI